MNDFPLSLLIGYSNSDSINFDKFIEDNGKRHKELIEKKKEIVRKKKITIENFL